MPGFQPNRANINKIFDTIMILFLWTMLIFTMFICLYVAYFPTGALSIGSLIPSEYFDIVFVKLIAVILHWHGIAILTTNVTIYGCTVMIYLS